MSITIKKIAEFVGVSRGTVDRALHGKYGVSEEVKEKVLEVAKKYNYTPNLSGRMLNAGTQDKFKIGVVIVTNKNAFFDKILKGIHDNLNTLKGFGVRAIVKIQEEYNEKEQIDILNELYSDGVKGILITPINSEMVEEKIAELTENGIKVVTVNSDTACDNRLAFVGCDFTKSGRVMAEILNLLQDEKKINVSILTSDKKNLAVMRRTQGLIKSLQKMGNKVFVIEKYDNDEDDELAYIATKKIILKNKSDYICVMGAGVSGALKAVTETDGSCPKILSYDMTPDAKKGMKNGDIVAVITQDPYRQGSLGVQILFDSIVKNVSPKKSLNYTELNIKTKNCI